MIRLSLILAFQIIMIIFTLVIMNFGFRQGNPELLYLGLGLPLWGYLLIFYSKWINKIEVSQSFFTLKNIVSKQQIIQYKNIEHWKKIQTTRISQQNLLIKANGKKLIISNMADSKNYEILRHKLETHLAKLEKN